MWFLIWARSRDYTTLHYSHRIEVLVCLQYAAYYVP